MQALQFRVTVTIPQQGPRGGKRAPLVEVYNVAATSRDEARAAFAEELPDMAPFVTGCSACECRVMRGYYVA